MFKDMFKYPCKNTDLRERLSDERVDAIATRPDRMVVWVFIGRENLQICVFAREIVISIL